MDPQQPSEVDAIIARARKAWLPPAPLSLSQWGEDNFVLSSETAAEPGRFRALPYQVGILDAITDPSITRVTWMKSARVGYALALDTPLPTSAGWTTMGDISVGDLLFDEAGRRCRVLSKSEVFTGHDCYRVRFCDGSEIIADADHRWPVESDVSLEHLVNERRGRTGRPKPGETRTFSGVLDTATMARAMRTSRGRTALAVPIAQPLDLDQQDLPIPPYTFGLWLGDGTSATARITQHRADVETADYITEEGIAVSVRYVDRRYPDNATLFLDVPYDGKPVSPWTTRLRELGLKNNKHIPAPYLRASREQRLALLRGLMDSDGTAGKNGRAEFVNTREVLARGVYELVVSLGMKATIHHRAPQRRGCLEQWRVNFKPTPDLNPFRIRRKAARVLVASRPSITKRRRVVGVDLVPSVPTQCVEVDSATHLFLAGRQMVPTHNTICISVAIGYFIEHAPTSMLVVQPTVNDAKGFSKETIAPMLRDVPALSRVVFADLEERGKGPKDSSQTLTHKTFPGGVLSLAGANSGTGFRRISRRVVLFDEVDAYPASAGTEGDPIKLGEKRSEYFWDRKIIAGSTPLVAGVSRIEEMFEAGDQRRFYVPCPHCKHMDYFRFNPQRDDDDIEAGHIMKWEKGKPETVCFMCRECGCAIEESSKLAMLEAGEWRAAPGRAFTGHASFHIWAAYSLSPNATWSQIATRFVEAGKDPTKLQTVINTDFGETWKEKGEAPDWEKLHDRAEAYEVGTVPDGVIVLTCGVDVQKDRLVPEVVGWGANRESWSILAEPILGDTSLERGELDSPWTKLGELLERPFLGEGEDGAEHHIALMAVDSGYNTQVVYAWCRQYVMTRVIACKGVGGARMLVGAPSPVDVTIRGKVMKRGYKVWPIGVDIAKGELYGWLRLKHKKGSPAPAGYCHFPTHHESYFQELTAEHLVTTVSRRTRRPKMEWQVQPNRENHYLDARVLARVAAAVLGIDRMAPGTKAAAAVPAATPSSPAAAAAPAPAPAQQPRAEKKGGFLNRPRGGGWLGRRR